MPANDSIPVPDRAAYELRIHACQRLLRWSIQRAQQGDGRPDDHGADLVVTSIFCRSTRTYEAVVRWLGERGFAEQGAMLNRSLFEDMVDAHWVHLNPDLAVTRLLEHDNWSRKLRADVQRDFPDWFDGARLRPPKLSNAKKRELRDRFGRHGQRSWTGVPRLDERLESVLTCWRSEDDRRRVRMYHAWVHKLNNEILHPSSFSIARLIDPKEGPEGDSLEWRFGSTTEWLPQTLAFAWWTYAQTVGLMIDRFGIATHEMLNEVLEEGARDFRRASHWERTGALDPLPDDPVAAGEHNDEPPSST